ncbi:hypothetical protein CIL03_10670 [Virgibacillus indicus]|uniref:DinB-like domain-containing protein n=1 Tax=Virgibacillus indicus TaxID=2024554 RepID=A0A265NAA6_9BACI|nr:DinB family protein [Virgibacillus indicus]OZU88741.1 hypothetical protein CIL03_10670 [Virgibacillus indicus]
MKSEKIEHYFHLVKQQREAFYHELTVNNIDPWRVPKAGKWTVGETLYHLVLMVRLVRRFSIFCIPVMTPIAYLRKNRTYKTEIHDIYQEYNQKKRKPMKAPFLLNPPKNLERKQTPAEIKALLESETSKLIKDIEHIDERIAGHIHYPDSIAFYPNLIQSVQLIAIHENHHYKLVKLYFNI